MEGSLKTVRKTGARILSAIIVADNAVGSFEELASGTELISRSITAEYKTQLRVRRTAETVVFKLLRQLLFLRTSRSYSLVEFCFTTP